MPLGREDRESALLTLALAGRMKRLDETDLAALAELADDSELTLAEFLRNRRKPAGLTASTKPATSAPAEVYPSKERATRP